MSQALLFQWRNAVLSESGPPSSTRRYVLILLSLHADTDGSNCFPSTRRLAAESKLSRRSVEEHLRLAEAEGWIERTRKGEGQDWAGMIYRFVIPGAQDDEREPEISEPEHRTFPTLSDLRRNGSGRIYPAEFEGAFDALPVRHVSHPKADAYRAWRARVGEVEELFQLEAAALAYAEECDREQKTGTQFVMMGSTFFGPGERWRPYSGLDVARAAPSSSGGPAYVSRSALAAT